jgi:hypothetical protein
LANLFLGSILIPRNFGFQKYIPQLMKIDNYNLIVAYFLLINLVLFLLSFSAVKKLNIKLAMDFPQKMEDTRLDIFHDYLRLFFALAIFILLSYFKAYSLFSLQLAIVVILFSDISYHRKWYRYYIYLLFLFLMVVFNYNNKREIIIIFFLVFFIEAYHSRWILKLTLKRILLYTTGILLFLTLILTASILRGYGNFKVTSVGDAISYIPQYVKSNVFMDGLTENLEINYNYGSAYTCMDMILKGEIKYQYGLTLIKVFFLPIPREIFPLKPLNSLQLYTKKYNPEYFKYGGSLPVNFSCDMFMNFNYLGVIPFALIWFVLDNLFVQFHLLRKRTLKYFSYLFLIISILPFARGSGIEQYIVYYLFALPALVPYVLLKDLIEKQKNKEDKIPE